VFGGGRASGQGAQRPAAVKPARAAARRSLRRPRVEDCAGLLALFDQADVRRALAASNPFADAADVRGFLDDFPPGAFEIVAVSGTVIVGHAVICPLTGLQGHTGTLTLAVHDAHRRRGIGIALLQALLETAESMMGLSRLQLTVLADNAPAIALYQRFGFAIEGRIRHFVERPDGFADAYLMARLGETGECPLSW
jgi:L-phenylalanine/L-methionine N-acetyltransferase